MKSKFLIISLAAAVMVLAGSNAYSLCTTSACRNGNLDACQCLCDQDNQLACDRLPDNDGDPPTTSNCSGATGLACQSGDVDACQCLCDQDDQLACDRLPDGGGYDGGGRFTCTEIIGFSQTKHYYDGGKIEDLIDGDKWQLRWKSGTGVEKWGVLSPLNSGWTSSSSLPGEYRCTSGSTNPDRVIFHVSSSDRNITVDEVRDYILNVIDIAADRYDNLKTIVFMTAIGGPGGSICQAPSGLPDAGKDVGASVHHSKYEDGIEAAVALKSLHPPGLEIVEGNHPEVGSCNWYLDEKGHLQWVYNDDMAKRMTNYYLPLH